MEIKVEFVLFSYSLGFDNFHLLNNKIDNKLKFVKKGLLHLSFGEKQSFKYF